MSAEQQASERVGGIIYETLKVFLQMNTVLGELRGFVRSGMDLKQLLAPHSLVAWECLVPQEKKFREGWELFVSGLEGADPVNVVTGPREAAVEPAVVKPTPAPLPVVAMREEAALLIQVAVCCLIDPLSFVNLRHSTPGGPQTPTRTGTNGSSDEGRAGKIPAYATCRLR